MEMTAEIDRLKPAELMGMLEETTGIKIQLLDVRELTKGSAMLEGAMNIPITELQGRIGELDRERMVVAYCT